MKVVTLPVSNLNDIPVGLRKLADDIESGKHGDAHNLVWVIDEGDGIVSVGMLGQCISAGAEAHLLMAKAQRRLENG